MDPVDRVTAVAQAVDHRPPTAGWAVVVTMEEDRRLAPDLAAPAAVQAAPEERVKDQVG